MNTIITVEFTLILTSKQVRGRCLLTFPLDKIWRILFNGKTKIGIGRQKMGLFSKVVVLVCFKWSGMAVRKWGQIYQGFNVLSVENEGT